MGKEGNGFIAFIPVRGGSKGIPGKNIKPICGRPLLYWVLEAASGCPQIDRVFVSTDDDAIAACARAFGHEKVSVVSRSRETATDSASTESAMLEFAEKNVFGAMILIQATSPLLRQEHLEAAIRRFTSEAAESLLSAVRQKRFLWEEDSAGARAINYDPLNRPLRQNFAGYLVENGAFYITRRKNLLESRCRISGRTIIQEMPEESYYEIDELADWEIVEALLRRSRSPLPGQALLDNIRLFVTDVDGVLTDAGMYYSEAGDELKKFNTRDGKAFELLRRQGILTAIITSENTRIVENRARKLKIDHVLQGVTQKAKALRQLCADIKVDLTHVAYIGDDINDLDVLPIVGFSACPADAMPAVKAIANYVCHLKGGEGCVREVVSMIGHSKSY